MRRVEGSFFSSRCLVDGDLYLPDDRPGPYPAVITCSGYQGLKTIHPERFARSLVPAGYACLSFDYRGFGASEGERGRLVPQEQAEDVMAAVSFLCSSEEVDAERVGLVGWALGGGVALAAAAEDSRVGAVAVINAVGDGGRTTRRLHSEESWAELVAAVERDRARRVREGRSARVPPFWVLPMDNVTTGYVDAELYKAHGFGSEVSLEAVDYLLRFRPDVLAGRLAPRPLLVVHGAENRLYLSEEADRIYAAAAEPKQRVLLEGAGHTEWMFDEHPTYLRVARLVQDFLDRELDPASLRGRRGGGLLGVGVG